MGSLSSTSGANSGFNPLKSYLGSGKQASVSSKNSPKEGLWQRIKNIFMKSTPIVPEAYIERSSFVGIQISAEGNNTEAKSVGVISTLKGIWESLLACIGVSGYAH